MPSTSKLFFTSATLILACAYCPVAGATSLPVANGDFENPTLSADDTFTSTSPPSWSVVINGSGSVGVERLAISHFTTGQPRSINGNQVAYINNGPFVLSETAVASPGTLTANTTYTLTMSIGDRTDTAFSGYTFGLFTATTPIVQETNAVTPADGTWVTRTLIYTALPSDPNLGQPLFVRYGNTSVGQTIFDAVSLDATTVPEPTSLGLLVVGAAMMMRWKQRGVRTS